MLKAGDRLARLQVVVAVFEPENLDRLRELVGRDLVRRAEGIAGALDDQGRRQQSGEMGGAGFSRFSGGWKE